jgi:hypothetical protein
MAGNAPGAVDLPAYLRLGRRAVSAARRGVSAHDAQDRAHRRKHPAARAERQPHGPSGAQDALGRRRGRASHHREPYIGLNYPHGAPRRDDHLAELVSQPRQRCRCSRRLCCWRGNSGAAARHDSRPGTCHTCRCGLGRGRNGRRCCGLFPANRHRREAGGKPRPHVKGGTSEQNGNHDKHGHCRSRMTGHPHFLPASQRSTEAS